MIVSEEYERAVADDMLRITAEEMRKVRLDIDKSHRVSIELLDVSRSSHGKLKN